MLTSIKNIFKNTAEFVVNNLRLVVLAAGAVFIALILIVTLLGSDQEEDAIVDKTEEIQSTDTTNANQDNKEIIAVEIENIQYSKMISTIDFEGSAFPKNYTRINSSKAGYVEKIIIPEGTKVVFGKNLIDVDKDLNESRYNASLAVLKNSLLDVYQAENSLKTNFYRLNSFRKNRDVAKQQFENEKKLFEQNLSAQVTVDKLESAYHSAEAQFQGLLLDFGDLSSDKIFNLNFVKQAEEQIDGKEKNISRVKFSYDLSPVPIFLERSLSKFEIAKANFIKAENDYTRTLVKAPFAGYVLGYMVDIGEYVKAGDTLVTFGDLDKMLINIYVPAVSVQNVNKNTKVKVSFSSLPGENFEGIVNSVSRDADSANKGYRVIVEVDNKDQKILSGVSARVSLALSDSKEYLTVPLPTVLQDTDGSYYLYTIDAAENAQKKAVDVGKIVNGRVEILSGLEEGDMVVVKSHQFLKDDQQVVIK